MFKNWVKYSTQIINVCRHILYVNLLIQQYFRRCLRSCSNQSRAIPKTNVSKTIKIVFQDLKQLVVGMDTYLLKNTATTFIYFKLKFLTLNKAHLRCNSVHRKNSTNVQICLSIVCIKN